MINRNTDFHRGLLRKSITLVGIVTVFHPAVEVLFFAEFNIHHFIAIAGGSTYLLIGIIPNWKFSVPKMSGLLMITGLIYLAYRIWSTNGIQGSNIAWYSIFPIYAVLFNSRSLLKWVILASTISFFTAYMFQTFLPFRAYNTYPEGLGAMFSAYVMLMLLYHIHLIFLYANHMQSQLHKQQIRSFHDSKLTGIGRLAGQIAHEVNTPLTALHFIMEKLRLDIASGNAEDIEVSFEKHENVVKKVSETMKVLLRSVKMSAEPELSFVDPQKIFSDLDILSAYRLRFLNIHFSLTTNFSGADEVFYSEPGSITQVLITLVNNSIDAISKLEDTEAERWIQLEFLKVEDKIEIRLRDSGPGVPEKNIPHLFAASFTTKMDGNGIGLNVAKEIIERIGGDICYDPTDPHTTFKMVFSDQVPNIKQIQEAS